jgi:hypothetical protein
VVASPRLATRVPIRVLEPRASRCWRFRYHSSRRQQPAALSALTEMVRKGRNRRKRSTDPQISEGPLASRMASTIIPFGGEELWKLNY